MLRWICDNTKPYNIINDNIRERIGQCAYRRKDGENSA